MGVLARLSVHSSGRYNRESRGRWKNALSSPGFHGDVKLPGYPTAVGDLFRCCLQKRRDESSFSSPSPPPPPRGEKEKPGVCGAPFRQHWLNQSPNCRWGYARNRAIL